MQQTKTETKTETKTARNTNRLGTPRIEFSLELGEANSVFLAGTFNNWGSGQIPLHKSADGVWKAKVALPPGRHEYRFVVDGQWVCDPKATIRVANPFGGENAVIVV